MPLANVDFVILDIYLDIGPQNCLVIDMILYNIDTLTV